LGNGTKTHFLLTVASGVGAACGAAGIGVGDPLAVAEALALHVVEAHWKGGRIARVAVWVVTAGVRVPTLKVVVPLHVGAGCYTQAVEVATTQTPGSSGRDDARRDDAGM